MIKYRFLVIIFLFLIFPLSLLGQGSIEGSNAVRQLYPSKSFSDSTAYLLGVNFGMVMVQNNFKRLNHDIILQGMDDALYAKGDDRTNPDFIKQFKIDIHKRVETLNAYIEKYDDLSKSGKGLLPPKSLSDSAAYLLGANFGFVIVDNKFKQLSREQILQGMDDALKSKGDNSDPGFSKQFKVDPNKMGKTLNAYIETMKVYEGALNKEKGDIFRKDFLLRNGADSTKTGLVYLIKKNGNDIHPTSDRDSVRVNYHGYFIDGTEFDNSEDIKLILYNVIPGIAEGIKLIGEGGQITLVIPAQLAFGSRQINSISPYSTLVFNINLLEVIPFNWEIKGKVNADAAEIDPGVLSFLQVVYPNVKDEMGSILKSEMTERFSKYLIECDYDPIYLTQDTYSADISPNPRFKKYKSYPNAYIVEWQRYRHHENVRNIVVIVKENGKYLVDNIIEEKDGIPSLLFDYSKPPVPVYQ